jgi:RNA polymerase sigma-70 factor (ECF subfamily)
LPKQTGLARFEQAALPFLDQAYSFARWLTGDDRTAELALQDAYVRAIEIFAGVPSAATRTWLFNIVRSACYTKLKLDADIESEAPAPAADSCDAADSGGPIVPEDAAVESRVEQLGIHLREVLVLRELDGFSYKEIAEIVGVPVGRVIRRLALAREGLGPPVGDAEAAVMEAAHDL